MKSPRLIDETGRGVWRIGVLMREGARAFWLPRPPLFWLSCLVALDGSIRIPSHRSEIDAATDDRPPPSGASNQPRRSRQPFTAADRVPSPPRLSMIRGARRYEEGARR